MTSGISNTTIWETSKGYMTGIFVRFAIDQKKNKRRKLQFKVEKIKELEQIHKFNPNPK